MATINNRLQIELEDGSIVVFHPESNTGQIYDFANGRWLDETIDEILNLLDNPEDTSQIITMLEEHIANNNMHVTSTEKSKWNNHVDDTVAHMTATDKTDLANAKAHASNSNIHITSAEKTDIASAKTHITDSTVHVTSAEKTDIATAKTHVTNSNIHVTASEKTDIANAKTHIANNNIHITSTEKVDLASAKTHITDTEIHVTFADKLNLATALSHANNAKIHLTETEKTSVVSHIENANLHVTQAQKTNWDTHIGNGNIHVTQAQKATWDTHIANGDFHFTVQEKELFWNHLEDSAGHVTYEDKAKWNDHANNTEAHVSASDRTNWNGLKNGIAVNSAIGATSAPSVYYSAGQRTHIVNASNDSIGITNVDEWCALETIVPYNGASSDKLTQLAYTKAGIYVRNSVGGDTATATWGAWDKLITAQEVIDAFSIIGNPTSTTYFTVGTRSTGTTGTNSLSQGTGNIVSGVQSSAFGRSNSVTGSASSAIGTSNSVSGNQAVAFGNTNVASGYASIAGGILSGATGTHSMAFGTGVNSFNYGQFCIGHYNVNSSLNPSTFVTAGDAFIIGGGSSSASRANVFRVNYSGSVHATGTFNSYGADYAEYFEWLDGNIDNEDRIGYVIALDGDKIRKANKSDVDILGITSGTASVIGDSYQDDWNGRYVTDEFGRVQYHWIDVEREEEEIIEDEEGQRTEIKKVIKREHHPIQNPNWNSEEEYVPREKRKEWSAVGLVGKIYVRHDGTLNVNDYAKVGNEDGVLTKSEELTNMRVIEKVSENVVRVFIK